MCSGVRFANVGVAEGLGASIRQILALYSRNTTASLRRRCFLRPARMRPRPRGWPIAVRRAHNCRSDKRKRTMWPDRRLLDLFKIEHPILLAPMAGSMDWELGAEAAEGGACGA